MGACIEYAARLGTPLMLYVFSDGSLSSNGAIDATLEGRGKGEWTSDNSSTAGSFFLVYNPGRRPALIGGTPEEQALHQQIGYMSADGAVQRAATPGANNVNLLVNMDDIDIDRSALSRYQDTSDSGQPVYRYSCAHCGSVMLTGSEDLTGRTVLKAGTLDDTSDIRPAVSIWERSAQASRSSR